MLWWNCHITLTTYSTSCSVHVHAPVTVSHVSQIDSTENFSFISSPEDTYLFPFRLSLFKPFYSYTSGVQIYSTDGSRVNSTCNFHVKSTVKILTIVQGTWINYLRHTMTIIKFKHTFVTPQYLKSLASTCSVFFRARCLATVGALLTVSSLNIYIYTDFQTS